MQIQYRDDKVIIDGYVNVVERLSRPITDRKGKFIERIRAGAFQRALNKTDNVPVLLNHDKNRQLACTNDETAMLYEDNIGLRAIMETSDEEVKKKAKEGKLRGWSFAFIPLKEETGTTEDGTMELRTIDDFEELVEVSLLDDRKTPAYIATSVEVREGGEAMVEYREGFTEMINESVTKRISRYYDNGKEETQTVTVENFTAQHVDLSEYENRINALKSAE